MSIELTCKCDCCKREIGLNDDCTTPPDGFAILGNIKERNAVGVGFVGNNLGDGDSP